MAFSETMVVDKMKMIEIVRKLQSKSTKEVLFALKEIRSNVIKTSAGVRELHERGGLKSLVRFLEKPNEKILNVSLSILANCCLDFDFRKEVGDFNVSSSIISILLNIETDSINGRACRLLGNLAQDYAIARQLHENDAIDALLATIAGGRSKRPSISTRQMAVRALGALWCVPDRRREMLKKNVVHTIAVMLTTETTQEMLHQILKVLVTFTRAPSIDCASQVNANGTGFEHLVTSVSNPVLKEHALMCIGYLCNVASVRPLLGNAGAVDALVTEVQESRSKPLLHALCLLSHESVNRAKIRDAGGLKILLTEARTEGRCLKSLEHYVYDESSLMMLLGAGLLSLLTELLAECKPPRLRSPKQKQKRERFSDTSPGIRSPRRTISPDSACYSKSPSPNPYTSPQSCGSYSPSYSMASLSNSESYFEYSESEREDNYSPVCSGDDSEAEDEDERRIRERKTRRHMDAAPILILLSRISHLETPIVNMASATTLTALLDYLTVDSDPQSRSGKILERLCSKPLNFIHVLVANFVPLAHRQLVASGAHSSVGTSLLAELSVVAESRFGVGEIERYLIKAAQAQKETICIAMPHLIRTPKLLKKLFLDFNGLAILVQVLEQTKDAVSKDNLEFSATSLNALAVTLEMTWKAQSFPTPSHEGKMMQPSTADDMVTFNLDDGSQITASKTLLCQESPYFEAMFGGHFCESKQTSISLPEITDHCLQHVIYLLKTGNLPPEMSVVHALELLKALDRFLIASDPRLTRLILGRLSTDSARVVYEQTLVLGNAPVFTFLRENALKYILATDLESKLRTQMFAELLVQFGHEFIENIENLIKTEICNKYDLMYKIRCK